MDLPAVDEQNGLKCCTDTHTGKGYKVHRQKNQCTTVDQRHDKHRRLHFPPFSRDLSSLPAGRMGAKGSGYAS